MGYGETKRGDKAMIKMSPLEIDQRHNTIRPCSVEQQKFIGK